MNYQKMHEISKKAALYTSIQNLLEWDQETYMPGEGIAIRGLQIEELAKLQHSHKTSKEYREALSQLVDIESGEILEATLNSRQKAAVREWRRDYLKLIRLPEAFVQRWAGETTKGSHAWIKAKESNNFHEFLPQLEKIVDLAKEKSELLGYQEHPYDALLDAFEPGMKTSTLIPLFSRLKEGLTELLKKIESKPIPQHDFIMGEFDSSKQMEFGSLLMEAFGLNSSISRLDLSAHPFCVGIHMQDTRLTTRIHPNSLMSNIDSVIHESGHALYHAGLPPEDFGSPLGEQVSLGIDESQSRFWETRIGCSRAFWRHYLPILKNYFPEKLRNVKLEDFYPAINRVQASLIRVEADEVTYSLHVILRFELEKALIEGSLKVKDLPEAWNEKMEKYLGLRPSNDAEGCLQDIHWSMGGIGYFPTYTLGNLYAAQFFIPFEKDNADWEERVSKGEFHFIREWLGSHIHRYGREYLPGDLIKKISGEHLTEKYFLEYLNKKYKEIYHL